MKYLYNLKNPNFTVENIDVLNVARDKGYKVHHSCRSKHAFIYTVSGMMKNTFVKENNRQIDVKAGELIFIPQNCDYIGTYFKEDTEIKIIQFNIVGENLPSYLCAPQKIILPEAQKLFDDMLTPLHTADASHPFYHLSCIYELLWKIDISDSKLPSKYKKLQPAFSEITEFYNDNKKIAYYAFLCNMSEANFRRRFHEYTQQTPIEYRNNVRLNHARMKLQSGLYNVSEVAEDCGFTNLSFFTRLYKKKFGHTPKEES